MSLYLTPILLFAAPCSCCKTFYLLQVVLLLFSLYSLACACVRIYLGGSEDSMLCTLYWNTNPICARTLGSSLLIFRTIFFGSFWLLASFVEVSFYLIFIYNLWILNIVWSPSQLFVIGYVHLISLILWEMHTLWGSSYYIGLLNFSPISAIDANGGEV